MIYKMSCPKLHYTPRETAKELLKDISFNENDIVLEPCKADGSFYDLIPCEKDWCEIEQGRDFFNYKFDKKFTKLIVNPPYKCNATLKNICWKFMKKCFDYDADECWFLINHNMFNGLTPKRLNETKNKGYCVNFIRVINIKKWYGRYYWICFAKNSKSILFF